MISRSCFYSFILQAVSSSETPSRAEAHVDAISDTATPHQPQVAASSDTPTPAHPQVDTSSQTLTPADPQVATISIRDAGTIIAKAGDSTEKYVGTFTLHQVQGSSGEREYHLEKIIKSNCKLYLS